MVSPEQSQHLKESRPPVLLAILAASCGAAGSMLVLLVGAVVLGTQMFSHIFGTLLFWGHDVLAGKTVVPTWDELGILLQALCLPTHVVVHAITWIDPSKTFAIIPMAPFPFVIGNSLAWYGIGSVVHGMFGLPEIWLPSARKKGIVIGLICMLLATLILVIGAAVASSPSQMAAAMDIERVSVPEPAVEPIMELTSDVLQVRLTDGKPVTIKRLQSKALFFGGDLPELQGRENRLAGSRIIHLSHQNDPPTFSITVTIEGSLFASERVYRYEGTGQIKQQSYQLDGDNGEEMTLDILETPTYERWLPWWQRTNH